MTEACEHEHIDTARACGHHAVEVQMDGPGVCDRCLSGPGGHECPTVILITWDDPAAPPTIARVPVSDFSEDLDDDE